MWGIVLIKWSLFDCEKAGLLTVRVTVAAAVTGGRGASSRYMLLSGHIKLGN